MYLYKRNIEKKLTSLKILLCIILSIGLIGIYFQYTNLLYFIGVCFISLSLITLTDLKVDKKEICISTIYFWGLIRINKYFEPRNLIFTPYGFSNFGENIDINTLFDSAEGEGLIFGCLLGAILSPKVVYRKFSFTKKSESINDSNEVMIDINEYLAIKKILPISSTD